MHTYTLLTLFLTVLDLFLASQHVDGLMEGLLSKIRQLCEKPVFTCSLNAVSVQGRVQLSLLLSTSLLMTTLA